MSVWKSDEKLLIFASLISPSKMILFEKKYQTFDTVFHHQMKHLEVRQKYSAARRIFNSLLSVSSGDETLRLMLDILFQPDWKISNGTLNGPIVTSTHILEHSWGPRTRTPGLSRRRTVQKFSFVGGAGYHRFKTPKFSQSKLAGMNDHLSETTAITF